MANEYFGLCDTDKDTFNLFNEQVNKTFATDLPIAQTDLLLSQSLPVKKKRPRS